MAKRSDKYVQYATITTTESAASTLTYQQLQTGGMLFERRAMIFHRVEYSSAAISSLEAEADILEIAITTGNQMVQLALADPNVVHYTTWRRVDFGTAASGSFYESPRVHDFSTLPGGGIIVPAHPIYLAVRGISLGAAQSVTARIYFTIVELSAQEFIELVEAMRIIT